ncbi:MAG TPA: RDD family protein [Pyrinomonadaceae bacterium]|nr:RDD family protein [Pyrinomonadaceae bacterium]
MIHDTVREELETKISRSIPPASKPSPVQTSAPSGNLVAPKVEIPTPVAAPIQPPLITSPPVITPPPVVSAPPVVAHSSPPPVVTQSSPPPVVTQSSPPPVMTQSAPPAPTRIPTAAPIANKIATRQAAPVPPTPAPKPIGTRFETGNLGGKKTSPTLVEFQTKKATVPEWRLQLQNSVRQKVGSDRRIDAVAEGQTSQPRSTSGANALKVEFVEEEQPSKHENPRVANALKRIEQSRRTFSNQPIVEQPVNLGGKSTTPRNYPFNVVARSNEPPKPPAGQKPTVNASPKPILVSPLKIEKKKYDTNKLPPLAKPAKHIEAPLLDDIPAVKETADAARERWENLDVENQIVESVESKDPDQIEDLAPFSMRFASAVFDLIVGVFATFILLSPFILSGGDWFTMSGGLAVAASIAIVMFLYLTVSIAFVGRSIGMKLFSLELVDIEENAYPTLHQAAVNSAVYLLSLAFAGLGFLTVFFNEERRAAHDILSGTILVREY